MDAPGRTAIFDCDALRAAWAGGWRPEFLFFWGHTAQGRAPGKHVLSQWWPAPFSLEGERYLSAEHYMMAEKARLFGDSETRARILSVSQPSAAKALGRSVAGFEEDIWARHRFDIVVKGSEAKFAQNAELLAYLLETGDKVLAEASPVDAVWGIGLAADDPGARDPSHWRGLNLLGFALMKARWALSAARPSQDKTTEA